MPALIIIAVGVALAVIVGFLLGLMDIVKHRDEAAERAYWRWIREQYSRKGGEG